MSTALRQRTHRKRLGGGGGAGWAVGMGGPFPCVSRCSGQPRPLREILTAATAPSKAVGLGARRWVARKVTATVAPASWHRYPICTARRQRCAIPLRRCTSHHPCAKEGTPRALPCPTEQALPSDSQKAQRSPPAQTVSAHACLPTPDLRGNQQPFTNVLVGAVLLFKSSINVLMVTRDATPSCDRWKSFVDYVVAKITRTLPPWQTQTLLPVDL